MTSEASMRVVLRHALELAAMKEDPQDAASQLVRSVSGDRDLLVEAHAYYSEILRTAPDDVDGRRMLTIVQWALTGASNNGVVIRAKKASATG